MNPRIKGDYCRSHLYFHKTLFLSGKIGVLTTTNLNALKNPCISYSFLNWEIKKLTSLIINVTIDFRYWKDSWEK